MKTQWEVILHDDFVPEYRELSESVQDGLVALTTILREKGPLLGRPQVDTLKGSRHANMKELRPLATNIRILFAFDPRRSAILLLGGDKTRQWQRWYRVNIPRADDLYDDYLATLKDEGLL